MITHEFWRDRASGELWAVELRDGLVKRCAGPLDVHDLDAMFLPALDYGVEHAAAIEERRAEFEVVTALGETHVELRGPGVALVVVDMLEDFVRGPLAAPAAGGLVQPIRRLLEHARAHGWEVVFANDAHQPGDPELRIWGAHALAGTPGAQVIRELEPTPGPHEHVVGKRWYGAFDGTQLDALLRARDIETVVLAGLHTHICIRHTAYGAFRCGFHVVVPRDAVCAFEGVDEQGALEYLRSVYGATVTTVDSVVAARAFAGA